MKELRNHIYTVLNTVTSKNSPKVHKLIQSVKGYQNIEQLIIRKMSNDNMTASGTIPHIEDML